MLYREDTGSRGSCSGLRYGTACASTAVHFLLGKCFWPLFGK
uniref:Uncharacterized protein n=1 Tax=Anguilla anguilla TaxID=7936 RepID=A0A0E9PH42_ANGAN